jgi:hypothetical protein
MASKSKAPVSAENLVEDITSNLRVRLEELRPAVKEYEEISAVLARVTGRETRRNSGGGGRGRPSGSGKRAQEALEDLKANPGSTVVQVAERLGIKQNYLYRVLPRLVEDGKAVRNADGTYSAASEQESSEES